MNRLTKGIINPTTCNTLESVERPVADNILTIPTIGNTVMNIAKTPRPDIKTVGLKKPVGNNANKKATREYS